MLSTTGVTASVTVLIEGWYIGRAEQYPWGWYWIGIYDEGEEEARRREDTLESIITAMTQL